MHTYNIVMPKRVTPQIHVRSLWRDEVDNINVRVIGITAIGIEVRCLSGDTSKVWETRMPRACFGTELVEVTTNDR